MRFTEVQHLIARVLVDGLRDCFSISGRKLLQKLSCLVEVKFRHSFDGQILR